MVEGLDGTGKSTLVRRLVQQLPGAVAFCTPPESTAVLRNFFDGTAVPEHIARAFYAAGNYLAAAEIAARAPRVAVLDR